MKFRKKVISSEVVKELSRRYDCDILTASVLARRGITEGKDIQFFLEDDLRFQHNPFLFNAMEDAVSRILDAKDEGENVLIFGDRDVDGVTSTALLYDYLTEIGMNVSWRIPTGDDGYGLSLEAVDDFANAAGTLIITVDCGISNNVEIAHANELGIDTIIVDHHNPPENLPDAAVIIDPKLPDSGYPFPDISGCAVTWKLVSALRFAATSVYCQDICLLNVRPVNDAFTIDAIKTRNLTEKSRISETIIPGTVSITDTRLVKFLSGQQIYVWDSPVQKKMLQTAFGKGVDFNVLDIRPEVAKKIPSVQDLSLLRLQALSKITKYNESSPLEIDSFFNIYVTFIQLLSASPKTKEREAFDLQLVSLAALADIMPLINENRIFVRQGLQAFNSGKIRYGLKELFARLELLGKTLSSIDLSWTVNPVLNAAGRLGNAEVALKLLTEKDASRRDILAGQIIQLNKDRKELSSNAWTFVEQSAYESLDRYNKKMVFVADERIARGITGALANKLSQHFKVPAMVLTFIGDGTAVGSVRSVKGFEITAFLDQFSDLFINYGGHDQAAGFSFTPDKLPEFTSRLERLGKLIELPDSQDAELIEIDAEIPHDYMTPNLLKLVDKFEPYGEANPPLNFLLKNTKIIQADFMGKAEKNHLKLMLDCGKHKWPARFWNAAARLGKDFSTGDYVDSIFQMNRNTFNGVESPQIVLTDCALSDGK